MIENEYALLRQRVFIDRQFDLSKYSEDYVKRRINARLFVLKIKKDNFAVYAEFLKKDPQEYVKLFDAFSINVTEFFRDPPLWNTLRQKYFPRLIEEKKKNTLPNIKIWSAGCSTGEEPYSIAMLLEGLLPPGFSLSITATDIDNDALEKAARGVYDEAQLKNASAVDKAIIKKYFCPVADEKHKDLMKMKITEGLKKYITFSQGNFMSDAGPRMNDMVFCRNAMIYIARHAKELIFQKVYDSLVDGGLFIIGKSEILPVLQGTYKFGIEFQPEHIYRKI